MMKNDDDYLLLPSMNNGEQWRTMNDDKQQKAVVRGPMQHGKNKY
jgi:hypothetical protein